MLPDDIQREISSFKKKSTNEKEKEILSIILDNAKIAKENQIPLCQDTGMSIFFIKMGSKVRINPERDIESILNEAVRVAYSKRDLRPSIVADPIKGKNTTDNTPSFIHIEYTNSNEIEINFMAKGGGSENASIAKTLNPSEGFGGIKKLCMNLVIEKGINACPPLLIGIGIGGTLDKAVVASKKILFRNIGERNQDEYYSKAELEIKDEINKSGIGAMGLGGNCTVLDVFIQQLPRHIASLPVAISILCHSARRGQIRI